MMQEQVKHANNERIDLRVWKRLVAYGLRYKPRVICTILVLLVVAGADLVYPCLPAMPSTILSLGPLPRVWAGLACCTCCWSRFKAWA